MDRRPPHHPGALTFMNLNGERPFVSLATHTTSHRNAYRGRRPDRRPLERTRPRSRRAPAGRT